MEKRLMISIVCVFIFFALFIATLPMTVYETMHADTTESDLDQVVEPTPEEREQRHAERLRSQTDNNLYRSAVSNDDRSRCANIQNHVLRQDCVEQTSEPQEETEPQEAESNEPRRQISSSDNLHFRTAVSNKDANRCEQIQSDQYRQECLELIQ